MNVHPGPTTRVAQLAAALCALCAVVVSVWGAPKLRNIAVALGNASTTPAVIAALRARRETASGLVAEHVDWALSRHHAGERNDTAQEET